MTDIIDFDQLKKTLHEFAAKRDWEQFHNPKNLAMALTVEASELLEIFQWLTVDESLAIKNQPELKEKVEHELADIMLYATRLASILDIRLSDAIPQKIALNNQKYPAGQVKGRANKYTNHT